LKISSASQPCANLKLQQPCLKNTLVKKMGAASLVKIGDQSGRLLGNVLFTQIDFNTNPGFSFSI
jgi:hypothetical protein